MSIPNKQIIAETLYVSHKILPVLSDLSQETIKFMIKYLETCDTNKLVEFLLFYYNLLMGNYDNTKFKHEYGITSIIINKDPIDLKTSINFTDYFEKIRIRIALSLDPSLKVDYIWITGFDKGVLYLESFLHKHMYNARSTIRTRSIDNPNVKFLEENIAKLLREFDRTYIILLKNLYYILENK